MRNVIVAIGLLLCIGLLGLSDVPPTMTPWQYGAIVLVGVPQSQERTLSTEATTAVNDVFGFWQTPVLSPAQDWASPVQTKPTSMMSMIEDTSKRVYVNTDQAGTYTVLSPPVWNGEKTYPLMIGFYPNAEALDKAWGDYESKSFYGPPVSSVLAESSLLTSLSTISMARGSNEQFVLRYMIATWLSVLTLTENLQDVKSSLPVLFTGGFAEYTASGLIPGDRWKEVAAAWAQGGGGLTDVPSPLAKDVGASVIAYLVNRDGKAATLSELPVIARDWKTQAQRITPQWRAWLSSVKLSEGDRALYEATRERLSLCGWLLKPVLSQTASKVIDRIYEGNGTLADIERFWTIVSVLPPKPSDTMWLRLNYREHTFGIVAQRDNAHQAESSEVMTNLGNYWRDWPNYYKWFVKGLHEVVAGLSNVEQKKQGGS